jgi:hypothetical protein
MNPTAASSAAAAFLPILLLIWLPSRAGADEFVMPSDGYLFIQSIGGEAGGITIFGLGTSPDDFVALLSGLPNSPSSLAPINAGFFAAGATTHFGMVTTFSGFSWAFSNGTDQASRVAFTDIDNSLGFGGSIIQQTSANTWALHLDDARSDLVDDDDNDVLIQLRITDQPLASVPEPVTGLLLLTGFALIGPRFRRP